MKCFALLFSAGAIAAMATTAVSAQDVGSTVANANRLMAPARVLACSVTQDHSVIGGTAMTVTFLNETNGPVTIYWLDYQGRHIAYKTLLAGQNAHQPTYAGHAWIVTDSAGNCLGYLLAGQQSFLQVGSVATPFVPHQVDSCTVTQDYSLNSDTATTIRFVNQTNSAVSVVWLDFAGNRVPYATLPAGQSLTQPTFATHPWEVLSPSGKCLGFLVAGQGSTLTVSNCAAYILLDSRGSGNSGGLSNPAQALFASL